MTATIADTEIDRYVAEVAAHLGALPEAERADLLDDLREHLAEVAAEGEGPLATRLGPPADYAAELLASAGLGARPAGPGPSTAQRLADGWHALRRHRFVLNVRAFLPELRPGWWVLRALLATFAFAVGIAGERDRVWPLPDALDLALVGLVLAPVALVVSVVARPAPPTRRRTATPRAPRSARRCGTGAARRG
jgi:hypothetical protein